MSVTKEQLKADLEGKLEICYAKLDQSLKARDHAQRCVEADLHLLQSVRRAQHQLELGNERDAKFILITGRF